MTSMDENREAGREIQRQLWGDRAADADSPATPAGKLAPDYFDLVRRYCFGDVWARPNLAVRDRSLITVAMLAALGKAGRAQGAPDGRSQCRHLTRRADRGADASGRVRRYPRRVLPRSPPRPRYWVRTDPEFSRAVFRRSSWLSSVAGSTRVLRRPNAR